MRDYTRAIELSTRAPGDIRILATDRFRGCVFQARRNGANPSDTARGPYLSSPQWGFPRLPACGWLVPHRLGRRRPPRPGPQGVAAASQGPANDAAARVAADLNRNSRKKSLLKAA